MMQVEPSWLANLAPELLPVAILGIVVFYIIKYGGPLIETLKNSFSEVSKQQNELIDRLEKLNQRETQNLQKELDRTNKDLETERIARADLERRFNESQRELITLKAELEVVQKDRKRVEEERDQLSEKVKTLEEQREKLSTKVATLESQVVTLQERLDKVNGGSKKE